MVASDDKIWTARFDTKQLIRPGVIQFGTLMGMVLVVRSTSLSPAIVMLCIAASSHWESLWHED